ncbi:pilus assembly protein [Demequina sp. TTPB684]|uniref:TadE family protein n=1 Tax=unclassified Demequina TaxID=2620311 RepID=UPI001CF28667|nr:TadE/TadG family type IV pilus assembly protein [Demequina sp. TMPB413]MCB2413561.1 pilus assembly protein [Demequina sp. TTPB684]UPU87219.1 pilus assembly protein [Demequina sp. TMPB413]
MLREGKHGQDDGNVVVEFVLVSILVITIAMGVIQLAVALHVRNMLVSAASEGARLAATNDRGLADGVERTESLLAESLGGYDASASAIDTVIDGAPATQVTITAPVPVFGLWGIGSMTVSARAFEEVDRD